MRARLTLVALALLQAGAGQAQEPIPKPELQLLSDVARYIKRDYAGATDDAVLASGCADAVATEAGSGERAARTLDAIPPLIMRAMSAAPSGVTYRKLALACIEGMTGMLDSQSKFLSETEVRALYRSAPAATSAAQASWGENDVLQLRLPRLVSTTRAELMRGLAALPNGATREPRGVLLDLRDNAGGTLLSAVDMSGIFLEEGVVVGALHGRGGRTASYRASERGPLYAIGPAIAASLSSALRRAPLAVLVNEHTAAGAEILAAALQGNGRARLVGEPTLGKGSVQTLFPLPGGAALRVTTAYWHTPKDVALDGRPLQPDVAAGGEAAMRAALRTLAEARR